MAEDVRTTTGSTWSNAELDRLLARLVVLAIVWNLLGNLLLPSWTYVPFNLLMVVLAVAFTRRVGFSWPDLGFDRAHLGRGLVIGVISVLLIAGVVLLAGVLPFFDGVFEAADSSDVEADSIRQRWFTALIRIPIGTAVAEEILFRSVLLAALVARLGRRRGIIVAAVAFGLWHIAPSFGTADGVVTGIASTIGVVLFTATAGLIFTGLRFWGRHVVTPILTHSATNTFAYLAAIISATG